MPGSKVDDLESVRLGQVDDNGGVYFVPAFSGLFAPYWRSDARGAIVGLSRFNTNAHLARATLEAICYQSRDVAEAMEADSGVRLEVLKVDGGVTDNDLCMQIQADVLGVDVVRPVVSETTALGAAYAAGLSVGFWSDPADLRANWREDKRWTPTWDDEQRALAAAKLLVARGMAIEITATEFESLHPRFAITNRYRRRCEEDGIPFKKNLRVDNIGIVLERPYEDARDTRKTK